MKLKAITTFCTFLAIAATPAFAAQDSSDDSAVPSAQPGSVSNRSSDETASTTQSTQQQSIRLSKLLQAKFQDSAGEKLGDLEDVLVEPGTGKINFVVLGRGGFLGIGEKLVPVPWQAVSMQSEGKFALNVDKEKLESAPTVKKDFSDFQNPEYAATVERFFGAPSAVGGSEGPEGMDTEPDATHSDGSRQQDSDTGEADKE